MHAPPPPPQERGKADQRYLARLEREGRRLGRWRDREIERLKKFSLEGEGALTPRAGWKREAWISFRTNRWDDSGHTIRANLAELELKGYGPLVGAIVDAALGHVDVAGFRSRDWTSDRARAVGAEMIALFLQSKRSYRKGPYQHCVTGITLSSFLALHENPYNGERPHRNTLIGVHRSDGTADNGGVGYNLALAETGAMYWSQMPVDKVEPYERWKVERVNKATGEVVIEEHASNRYHLLTSHIDNAHATERTRARLRELAERCAVLTERRIALRPHLNGRRRELLAVVDVDPAPS